MRDRGAPGSSGVILLAEDHPVNQRVATAMLQNLGFHVDVVADGAEAVEAAIAAPYRVILMDCQLPVLDGFQAATAIREQEGSRGRTPIIAVTAEETDRQRCLDAGMDDLLVKPLSLRSLGTVLERWAPDGSDHTGAADLEDDLPITPNGPFVDLTSGVLDPHVVDRLERLGRAAGEDLLGQLSAMFLSDADASLIALRDALVGDDFAAVNRAAHALTGASANVGATDLARMCAALARDGAAGDLERGSEQFGVIEIELERVRSAIASWAPVP